MAHNYGLIGKNISYSFSAGYFADKFRASGLVSHHYQNYDLPEIDAIREVFEKTPGLEGLNVTIPYKEKIIPYLDALDPVAEAIGAVNTIAFNNGTTKGFNTDAYGFTMAIKPLLSENTSRALILGTGGASKAVIYALNQLGIKTLKVSRTKTEDTITYAELDEQIMKKHQLIVNCTPLGTFPEVEAKPGIPYQWLTKKHVLFDLIYNPEETAFLREGSERGSQTMNGYQMLVHQAEKAWEIWNS